MNTKTQPDPNTVTGRERAGWHGLIVMMALLVCVMGVLHNDRLRTTSVPLTDAEQQLFADYTRLEVEIPALTDGLTLTVEEAGQEFTGRIRLDEHDIPGFIVHEDAGEVRLRVVDLDKHRMHLDEFRAILPDVAARIRAEVNALQQVAATQRNARESQQRTHESNRESW